MLRTVNTGPDISFGRTTRLAALCAGLLIGQTSLIAAQDLSAPRAASALGTTEETTEPPMPLEFAPGAQGEITAPLGQILDDAKRRGEELGQSLAIQPPHDFGVTPDIEEYRRQALMNPRLRALLGIDEGQGAEMPEDEGRYGNSRVFLLASFSMPAPVLRAMMQESIALEVPIVFNGFVNNSVFDTQAALQATFGEDADLVGFGIDPTLFARFGVTSVPQVIVTQVDLDVCDTMGCQGDPAPVHDRVAGNIPLRAALDLIAKGNGDAAGVARLVLASHPEGAGQ